MTADEKVAIIIFGVTFAVILGERVHRTIAAMAGAAVMLVVGMLLGFYSQASALAAVDFNTLGLLLGMMILVRLLEQTGFFEYIAILTAKRVGGRPWLLLLVLAGATTLLSMFLDNVTTVVLIVPVTILIAQILGLSPLPLLMAEALLSNIGGVATLVGDPPNVLIGSASGLSFTAFLTHLGPIVAVTWLVAIGILRVVYRHEMAERPRNSAALAGLNENQALRDPVGVRKILIVLAAVVLLFFLHGSLHLQPATVALMGAAAALIWVRPDVEETLRHLEWSVLLFFAALFVLTGGLAASGVLGRVAALLAEPAKNNPLAASLALLWVAAIISAVVDNIPFTIAMLPVIQDLSGLGVGVLPFWWALALGAGLGGNGTPIGATANVITVALSGKTHTPITTRRWLRSGLPVTIATCVVASALFALLFGWMSSP
jgi:Na+/H+ antiporter NhaD/arsenite permease-like protein